MDWADKLATHPSEGGPHQRENGLPLRGAYSWLVLGIGKSDPNYPVYLVREVYLSGRFYEAGAATRKMTNVVAQTQRQNSRVRL